MVRRLGLLCVVAVGVSVAPARADLLGVAPGLPRGIVTGSGLASYAPPDPASGSPGVLTISGRPASMQWAEAGDFRSSAIVSPRSLVMTIYLDAEGRLLGGPGIRQFELTGSVTERDPVTGTTVKTYAGTLLRGEVLEFGFRDAPSPDPDLMDFRFRITGGSLATRMGPNALGVTLKIPNSTFAGFATSFTGGVDGSLGPVCGARIGDWVWDDVDRDGLQDSSELGLEGVVVNLSTLEGSPLATMPTDATGRYRFSGLCAGSYRVTLGAPPSGLDPTIQCSSDPTHPDYTPGCSPLKDSSLSPVDVVVPFNNTEDVSVDFGFTVRLLQLGGRVWHDLDADGIQDGGEPGLVGLAVRITKPSGASVRTSTGENGRYRLLGLDPGEYKVCVTQPDGFRQTYDLDFPLTGGCATVTLPPERNDVDFGYQQYASIGDRVWHDQDADRAQDGGESGLSGWLVELRRPSGVTTPGTTGPDGIYLFDMLVPGAYQVCVVPLPNYAQTHDLDFPASPDCASVTVGAGEFRTDVDFGYQRAAEIGGRVWHDADADGRRDAGEASFVGAKAVLLGARHMTATTGSDGKFLFSPLAPGSYTVCVMPPADARETFDLDFPATPHCALVTVEAAQSRADVHFGYQQYASIGDLVWEDWNGDGTVGTGEEPGIEDAIVTLSDAGGLVRAVATTGDGQYSLDQLLPGTYTVCVVLTGPAMAQTWDADGLDTPGCATVSLKAGDRRQDLDFGYRVPSS